MARRTIEPLEHDTQCAFMDWWAYFSKIVKLDERLMYAVPNAGAGASKGQAGKMKAEGVRPGIPDVNLDVPRNGSHGLRLEFKRRGRKPEPHQLEMADLLRAQGFQVFFVYSLDEAMRVVMAYLGYRRAAAT
jgi:hypothetical protein